MKTSKTIRCLIIDDELSSQRVLQHFIAETEVLELKQTCSNTTEAFKYLQLNDTIDLLFLDINMPQQTGLEFYKTLQNAPKVIFTTAYPQYAVDGFEVNAIDYLLKPISYERFLIAVRKVLDKTSSIEKPEDFIILKENKTLHKVFFADIQFAEAFGDYVKVHLKDKTIITHSTFLKFTTQLPNYFIRTHKSFSINLNKMHQVSGNQIHIGLHIIPIGQTYKATVLKALNL
ncbi:LytR/AlgR family response regulator transcription factor [Winogradskyella immobilis]|uniref:Response regulator transcription factor n=1 Tax=Winogradskyella immobilis TaxID=2816852 RepID=A0ABS8ELX7_9FLAO|nr:LytTR family DNA-binding domain-containing protein [Winogradskyella immobilis]MCC1484218.1 response regulator transcription factor [Winogradskyella immobilis]MCG0016310.1 LytTR family DNA-binding domain-containing protein [Winogradskyella immobilis]